MILWFLSIFRYSLLFTKFTCGTFWGLYSGRAHFYAHRDEKFAAANALCVLEAEMSPSGMPREKSFLVGRQVLVRVVGETRQGQ